MKDYITLRNTCRLNGLLSALFILALGLLVSCTPDDEPAFSVVPEIELVGISSDTIVEFEGVLVIKIKYRDGDGNLGLEDPDRNSIFVRDARLQDYDGFYLGPIAPLGEEIAISGELDIEFPSLFIFGSSESETSRFYVYIQDRDGNQSNEVITPDVTIVKAE